MSSTTAETIQSDVIYFKYHEVKRKYLEGIQDLIRNSTNMNRLFTKRRLLQIAKLVKAAKENEAVGKSTSRQQQRLSKAFDIIETENGRRVIKKRLSNHDSVREYITYEDSFDIIRDAHEATAHGKRDKIRERLKSKYIIHRKCIELFVNLCNVCRSRTMKENVMRNSLPHPTYRNRSSGAFNYFNRRSFVFIINMTDGADDPFAYIMVVRDSSTGFTQIRPLATSDHMEVAIELFKIFTDFGPPLSILVSNVEYFQKVHKIVSELCSDFSQISIRKVSVSLQNFANQVQYYLRGWSKASNTKNWAVGCFMIQWSINNTAEFKKLHTPFQGVFGSCYSDPLQCLPPSVRPKPPTEADPNVVEVSDDSTNSDIEEQADIITADESQESSSATPLKNDTGRFIGTILNGVYKDTNIIQESLNNVVKDLENPFASSIIKETESIKPIEDILTLPVDNAKISVVSVEISDNEMDVDEENKESLMCCHCNSEIDELNICQRCNKPVHRSCSKKLTVKGQINIACFSCLTDIKKKIELLRQKVRENSNNVKRMPVLD